MNKLDNAKSTLWYYFELIARKAGANLDSDCRIEIEGIVDDIVESIDTPIVAHGKWIIYSDGYYPYCSECKTKPKNKELTNFCHNCGAKMDLKD